jgi:integrase
MSVFKMKDKPHGKPRKSPWCCEVQDAQGKNKRVFRKTKAEAQEVYEEYRTRFRRTGLGLPGTIRELKQHTARDVVRSYISNGDLSQGDEDVPEGASNVFLALTKFASRDICSLNLFQFNRQVAEQYRDDRLKETWKPRGSKGEPKLISPRTVRWEISYLLQAWEMARRWPDLSQLENPWRGMRVKGSTGGRLKQGLKPGELDKLIASCNGCLGENRFYVPLAIYLAIETGMRRQEILDLTWEDIDFDNHRIKIRKSKTDWVTGIKDGVNTILPFDAKWMLLRLAVSLGRDGRLPGPDRIKVTEAGSLPTGKLFPMTKEAFTQTFRDVVKRAGLKNITFRSTLRTTANTGFFQAKLNEKELDIMMRHTDTSTNAKFYTDRDALLPQIQEKLERHKFNGKTLKEVEQDITEEWAALMAEGIENGLTPEDASARAEKIEFNRPGWVRVRALIATFPKSGATGRDHQDQSA